MLFLFLNKSLDLGWVRTVGKETFCKEFSLSNFVAIILHFVLPLIPLSDPPPPSLPPPKKKKIGMTITVNISLDYLEEIRRTGYASYFGSNKLHSMGNTTMSVLGASEFLKVNFQAKHCEISSLCS